MRRLPVTMIFNGVRRSESTADSVRSSGRRVAGVLIALALGIPAASCRKKEAAAEGGEARGTARAATEPITPKPGPAQIAQVTLKIGASSGLRDPHGIAVDGRGNIFVVDTGNTRVVKFDPSGRELLAFGKKGSGAGQFVKPLAVAVSPQGNLFVLDSETSWIQIFAPDGKYLNRMAGPEMSLYHPAGVAVASDGTVAIADTGGNRVVLLDSDGKRKGNPIIRFDEQPFSQPTDVYFDPRGGLHVYQTASAKFPSTLFHLSSTGEPATKWIAPDASSTTDTPRFVLAPDGHLYMSDPHLRQVRVYDADGAQFHVININATGSEAVTFKLVAGVAIDGQGRLYVVDAKAGLVYRT